MTITKGELKEGWVKLLSIVHRPLLAFCILCTSKGNKPVFEKSAIAPVIHLHMLSSPRS